MARFRNVFTIVKAIRLPTYRIRKVKAMYRKRTILARRISPLLKTRDLRVLCIFSAESLVFVVGFSRIALGAHFLTDVLAAIIFGVIWLTLEFFAVPASHRQGTFKFCL